MDEVCVDDSKNFSKGTSNQSYKLLPSDFVVDENDVLCGRGSRCFNHSGNKKFRKIVEANLERYAQCETKFEKTEVICEIIDKIVNESPNGGFVKFDAETGRYYEVGYLLAREKTSQAFRDSLQDLYKSSTATKKKKRFDSSSLRKSRSASKERLKKQHLSSASVESLKYMHEFEYDTVDNNQSEPIQMNSLDMDWIGKRPSSFQNFDCIRKTSITNAFGTGISSAPNIKCNSSSNESDHRSFINSGFLKFNVEAFANASSITEQFRYFKNPGNKSTMMNDIRAIDRSHHQISFSSQNEFQSTALSTDEKNWDSTTITSTKYEGDQNIGKIPTKFENTFDLSEFDLPIMNNQIVAIEKNSDKEIQKKLVHEYKNFEESNSGISIKTSEEKKFILTDNWDITRQPDDAVQLRENEDILFLNKARGETACGIINPLLTRIFGGVYGKRHELRSISGKQNVIQSASNQYHMLDEDKERTQFFSESSITPSFMQRDQFYQSFYYGDNTNSGNNGIEKDLLESYFDEADWEMIQCPSIFN